MKDWKKYETRVVVLLDALSKKLAEDYGAEILNVEHDIKIGGAAGIEHQIDGFIEYRIGSKQFIRLCECKFCEKDEFAQRDKIDLPTVVHFHAVISDIQMKKGDSYTVEGNLYTNVADVGPSKRHGYTKPAKKYADFYGIATNYATLDTSGGWSVSSKQVTIIGLRTAVLKAT